MALSCLRERSYSVISKNVSRNVANEVRRAPPTTQVSRERVGCELDQMVRSAAPLRAFQLMDDMNLLEIVFPLPEGFDLPMDDDRTRAYEFGMVYLKVSIQYRRQDREGCFAYNHSVGSADGLVFFHPFAKTKVIPWSYLSDSCVAIIEPVRGGKY